MLREGHGESGSLAVPAYAPDRPTMILHDPARDSQPQSHSPLACAVERFEYLLMVLFENARSIVHDLQHHFAVGTTDHFDEFLVVLGRLMRWPLSSLVYQRRNVTAKRPTVSGIAPHVVEEIRHHNEYDCRLYKLAESMLAARIAEYDGWFARDLDLFKELNRLHADGANSAVLRRRETAGISVGRQA